MSISKVLEGRRTIHKFNSDKVDPKIIDEAIRLAHFAPNHKLTQPVRYIKASAETREKFLQLAIEMKEAKAPMSPEKKSQMKKKYRETSDLIIINRVHNKNPMIAKEDYATVAMAIQNISLFLWEHGVGSKWSSGSILENPRTYDILGLNPNDEIVEAFLWVGMAEVVPAPIPRRNISEFVREI